jgi:hypothetical protein
VLVCCPAVLVCCLVLLRSSSTRPSFTSASCCGWPWARRSTQENAGRNAIQSFVETAEKSNQRAGWSWIVWAGKLDRLKGVPALLHLISLQLSHSSSCADAGPNEPLPRKNLQLVLLSAHSVWCQSQQLPNQPLSGHPYRRPQRRLVFVLHSTPSSLCSLATQLPFTTTNTPTQSPSATMHLLRALRLSQLWRCGTVCHGYVAGRRVCRVQQGVRRDPCPPACHWCRWCRSVRFLGHCSACLGKVCLHS